MADHRSDNPSRRSLRLASARGQRPSSGDAERWQAGVDDVPAVDRRPREGFGGEGASSRLPFSRGAQMARGRLHHDPRPARQTTALLIGTLVLIGIAVALLSVLTGIPSPSASADPTAMSGGSVQGAAPSDMVQGGSDLASQAVAAAESTVTLGEDLAVGVMRSYSASDFDAIPQSTSPITFTLASPTGDARSADGTATALTGDDAPSLDPSVLTELENSIDAVRAACDPADAGASPQGESSTSALSFIALDLSNGNGIALDADGTVYGASSIKGPYALYICEEQVETGSVGLDAVSDLLTDCIVWSDNDAFFSLRDWFDSDWEDWVGQLDVNDMPLDPDSDFCWYSPRSALKLWNEAAHYLSTGSRTADWLADLYAQTDTSFLRQAVGQTGAVVLDKAGWIASGENYDALVDAGIIERGGHIYLVSIMSSLSDTDEHRALFVDLAESVIDSVASLS